MAIDRSYITKEFLCFLFTWDIFRMNFRYVLFGIRVAILDKFENGDASSVRADADIYICRHDGGGLLSGAVNQGTFIWSFRFYFRVQAARKNYFSSFSFNFSLIKKMWSSGQSSWLQIRRPGFDYRHYKKKMSGSGTGSTQPREYNWGATW
jgi:hypothetical protein